MGENVSTSCLIHRDIQQKLNKPLEILEYVGFVTKREASRGMKSGGRGARYAVNFCNLLENVAGKRVSVNIFNDWIKEEKDPYEFHTSSSKFSTIEIPELDGTKELAILGYPIETLKKSKIYPYGLTDAKCKSLLDAGIVTINDLAMATDAKLLDIAGIGDAFLNRIRNVVGQAIWM